MSSENRAAAVVDWIARLAGRIAPAWSQLKERARQNLGFLAAAAAGTIGLVLALGLLANAGLDWFSGSGPTLDQELANDDLQSDLGNEGDLADTSPYADSFAQIRAESERAKLISREQDDQTDPILGTRAFGSREANGRHVLDEDERSALEIDDEEFSSGTKHPLRARPVRQFSRNEKIENADDDSDDLDAHPLAENTDNGRSRVQLPADLDDEKSFDESEPENEPGLDDARDSLTRDPPGKLKKPKGPAIAANPLAEDDESENDAAETPAGGHPLSADNSDTGDHAGDALDAAEPAKSSKNKKRTAVVIDDPDEDQAQAAPAQAPAAGWKRQLSQAGDSAPTLSARQSRPVETVIYSVPEVRSPAAKPASQPNESAADSALRIEVLGPKSVGVGQTCSVEIRVTNRGRVPEQKLALEVELPAGLEHEVARNLSQTIGELGPGKMYRALLNLKAASAGKALIRIDVERHGRIDATSSATIEVGGKPVAAERAILLDCCCPLLPCCVF